MSSFIYVPDSRRTAGRHLRLALATSLDQLSKTEFVRVWSSIAYLYPGLHPDGFEESGSGWPSALKRFATEAWRRARNGELNDDEIYPCDAQWSGLYDQMVTHLPEETVRRLELAASFGEPESDGRHKN